MPEDLAWRCTATASGLQRADVVIAPSSSFAGALRAVYGRGFTATVIHNGCSAQDRWKPARRERFVLSVGRVWDDAKNFRILDDCAALLQTPVLAVGPIAGPNGKVERFPHIQLLGHVDERQLFALYSRATAFVSSAMYEPFGLAVLEAALAETPLILADIPTFRELWSGAAIFCRADDADAFADAIRNLQTDPTECMRLGRASRERARRYTRAAMVKGVLRAYRTIPRHVAAGRAA